MRGCQFPALGNNAVLFYRSVDAIERTRSLLLHVMYLLHRRSLNSFSYVVHVCSVVNSSEEVSMHIEILHVATMIGMPLA